MTPDIPKPVNYKKLPGSASFGRIQPSIIAVVYDRNTLYVGDDHLLCVHGYYTERYHRFSFRDIQGIAIQRTSTWLVSAAILGAVLLFLLMLFGVGISQTTGDDMTAVLILFSFIIVPLAVALGMHLFQGPSCKFFIKTAVQCKELPALSRLRSARAAIACLQPLIEQAQADLPALSQATYLLEMGGRRQPATVPATPPQETETPGPAASASPDTPAGQEAG